MAGTDLRRQRARLASAAALRLRANECRLRPVRSGDQSSSAACSRCRRAGWPAHRRRVQRGDGRRCTGRRRRRSWGFTIAGRAERPHPDTPELVRRAFWIDARRGRKGAATGEVGRVAGARPSPAAAGPSGSVAAPRRPALRATWLPSRRAALAGARDALAGRGTLRRRPRDVGVRHRPDRGAGRCAGHRGARSSCARAARRLEPHRLRRD